MICACCGLEIQERAHGPYVTLSGHQDYVCDRCWNDPSLSFPDKTSNFSIPLGETNGYVLDLFKLCGLLVGTPSSDIVRVSAVRLFQGGVTAYLGKMKAADILTLYDIRQWNELTLSGYQRQLYNERKREIAHYLKDCPIPVIPAIFVSIRKDTRFIPVDGGDIGTLEIPRKKGSIMLIDGQHRMAGFQWYAEELAKEVLGKKSEISSEEITEEFERCIEILRYDVPVLFLDSKSAVDVLDIDLNHNGSKKKVVPEDVERVIFYIVNKTQKGISPSLKDTLQFLMYKSGIRGIPSIEKERWRVDAAEIGHRLNQSGSPLAGKINLSGARGLGKPLQLNSWVTSLKPLFLLESFKELDPIEKYDFVKTYWSTIEKMFEEAFEDNKIYLLLKSIGVYSLNLLATNIYEWCKARGMQATKKNISKFLEPLKDFNWRGREPNPSPLRGLGGKAGVNEAYKIMLEILASGGILEAAEKTLKSDETVVQSIS
ncbi:DGQHR domain-containing protein [Candidatus Bathyarchaeota archaeon]|nr:DGQHR domain-containing protein [Candidatus Bathyarchaeota archaeon]